MPPNPTVVKKLTDDINNLTKLCKDLKKEGDKEICSNANRKKAASGQHGIKDNATNGQVREGLEERIDQLKRDLQKEQSKK